MPINGYAPFHTKLTYMLLCLCFVCCFSVQAKVQSDKITTDEIEEVIASAADMLNSSYIFPKVAADIETLLRNNQQTGAYDHISSGRELAQRLTTDVQSVSNDLHMRVFFDPKRIARIRAKEGQVQTPEEMAQELLERKRKNFGFHEVKILNGNVGYIDLRRFDNTEYAGDTAAAAMNFVSNTDALIFDVRNNGGGSPSMNQLLISYLLESDPVHLNSFYSRPTDKTKQTWSLPYVPGKRSPDVDVYVLTSKSSFSAAEGFSYTLKIWGGPLWWEKPPLVARMLGEEKY